MVSVRVPLTQGKFARVSIQDAERVMAFKWSLQRRRNTCYAQRHVVVNGKRTTISLHRFIVGGKSGEALDHKDRNGLNCTRTNLRPATNTQNHANHGPLPNTTSGYRGVSFWNDPRMKNHWVAMIFVDGKNTYLGSFATAKEAAKKWNEAAVRAWGEFALLNVVEEDE